MSLVQSVLERYGAPTDKTDTSPSVSSVSESPKRFKGEKGTSVGSVSESGRHSGETHPVEDTSPKRLDHPLTELPQGSELPPIIRGIGLDELQGEAGEDWDHIAEDPERLEAYAELVKTTRMMRAGKVPPSYTATTECRRCGLVPIFEGCPPKVAGCPWCFNRGRGLPMPEDDCQA